MELKFPFRNIAINTLLDFFKKDKVKDFSDFKTGKEQWMEEHFNSDVAMYRDRLPDFENEILQTINTTDQKTIDNYFTGLRTSLNNFKEYLTKDYFTQTINEWNTEILKKYSEEVEKEGEDYAKSESRKMKHLEEYDGLEYSGFGFGLTNRKAEKIRKINYNFYCIEKIADVIDTNIIDEYFNLVSSLYIDLNEIAIKYGIPWQEGKLKSKIEAQFIPKPIVFVEGDHDITLINRAAEHLDKTEILKKIELRQRGGYKNLDKLWTVLNEQSWETIPQTKIFLYDCDTNKENEDFGNHYKRIIPTNLNGIVKKGIENLFSSELINKAISAKKAYVDLKKTIGTKRGIDYEEEQNEINKDEKKNFCDWVCENGTKDDFENFMVIFNIIEAYS